MDYLSIQWIILLAFGLLFFFLAPWARNAEEFFSAKRQSGARPGFWILTSSLVISWIFAKSITNAANLGLSYGIVGGFSYALYYLSFMVAGQVIFQLRTQGNFRSIHHFLEQRFGKAAILLFSLLIGIRLFNEVWSNTMVIGSYFGAVGESSYYLAILSFTVLSLAYTLKGGLRSSLLTDAIQMVFFGLLLIITLGYIFPQENGSPIELISTGTWSSNDGLNLALVALLQIFSYPFHDPVLTDRAFIGNAQTTRKSFQAATVIGFICILLFSLVGVYAQREQLNGEAAVEVAKLLGVGSMLAMNFIMVTSAASTLDSTLASFSKLLVVDLSWLQKNIKNGRLAMLFIAAAGSLPLVANPTVLSATTVSGTMVMGLAPVFVFWKKANSAWSFFLPVLSGLILGILLAANAFPESLVFSSGPYSVLLWCNIWGVGFATILFFIPKFFEK
jgi:Na+/proline symporter